MRKLKLFSLALMALFATQMWGATETVTKSKDNWTGVSCTISNAECANGSADAMKDGDTENVTYIKFRTNKNGNTLTLNVKSGYRVTGLSVRGYSNDDSKAVKLASVKYDSNAAITVNQSFPKGTSKTEGTTYTYSNTTSEATNSIVLSFSDNAGTQIMAVIKITYEGTTKHTVTYNLNGAPGDGPTESDKGQYAVFTLAAAPTYTGYRFTGWNDGSQTYAALADYTMPNSNVTLTAQWAPVYTVTYDATTGSGTMTDANSPYAAGDEVTLLANTFEAPDASSAWSAWDVYKTGEPATKVEVSEGKFTMPAYNVTVAAQWATAYDVKFFQGYGEPDAQIGETQSIGEGAFAVAPANPERDGFVFAGWSYDATKAHIVNVDEYAITATTNFTAIWDELYAITKAAVTNGSITVSAESAIEGASVTLTATPAFRYLFGAWDVYKTGDESTKVTVTNNKFTMPEYAVTVSATFTADARKQILYLKSSTSTSNDKMYSALNSVEDYNVIVEVPASQTVTNYDLVVLHESLSGSLAKSDGNAMIRGLKTADVPVLNTKSYFYNSDRWDWGTPNAGTSVTGATLNSAYCNTASHPIFEGVTISEGFVTLFSEAKAKAMQPVEPKSGKEGFTLATTSNDGNGTGTTCIQELTPAQRGIEGVSTSKYLLISIGNENGCFNLLTADGQKLLKNAAAYLLSDETWTPKTLEVTIADGIEHGSVDVDIDCAAADDEITLSNNPSDGYKLRAYDVYKTGEPATKVSVTSGKFTMPAYAVTVSATFAELIDITCATGLVNGSVAADMEKAIEGETVTLSNTPAEGYILDAYDVYKTGDAETKVPVTEGKFTMPDYPVTVSATFKVDPSTALDNTDAAVKAVKRLENGMLVIEKNGVRYNAMGQTIR